MSNTRTFLAGATTMAAALAAIFALTGARAPAKHEHFDEITVGRINIVEPDGTKRIVISNKAQFPGDFMQGKENPRPDRRAFGGMIFINEEGTENGGLVQKGNISADGKVSSGLSLTFDRFRQDQTLQLLNEDGERHQRTALMINDVPNFTVTSTEDIKKFNEEARKLPKTEREAFWQKLSDENRLPANRIYLGNTGDQRSTLELKDAKGNVRMMLAVTAEGQAEIKMFDAKGTVLKTISAIQ